MKRIGVVTATRAEYGILKNTIKAINEDKGLELVLIVTGTHLDFEYGHTIDEIKEDGLPIAEEVAILDKTDGFMGAAKTMGNASIRFADLFSRQPLDMLIVLGDRSEILAICSVAMVAGIPIAHISGGEITEGAIDDAIRHCITKMSYLHFPGCEEYRHRIIQLGESPDRVFNFGDVGIENLKNLDYMPKEELERSIEFTLDKPYFSITFHPVTLEKATGGVQVKELLKAIEHFPDYKFIITKANADSGNKEINAVIDEFVQEHSNCKAFYSLGIRRYLSLLKYSNGVIGNSSSGIVEAPFLKIPTIDIGDRQKGRLKAASIIECAPAMNEIVAAINKSQSSEFKKVCSEVESLYGEGNTSAKIVETIKDFLFNNKIDLKKKFYDVEFKAE